MVVLSFTLSILAGCVDYTLNDPDSESVAPVVVEERFVQDALPAVDVLFVVDSTGSMAEEQAGLAAAAETFVNALDGVGVSYQLGVVSTDPSEAGALLGRPWIITAAADDPSAALAAALQVGTDSPPPAAGLAAVLAALDDNQGLNRGFRRADAGLQVIFVSDGDDESEAALGDDPAAVFLDALAQDAASSGHTARASAVVGDVPAGCRSDTGNASPGVRYTAVAEATGGMVASICGADFGAVAEALGDASVTWPTSFTLQAVPVVSTVTVTVDGERLDDGWSVDTSVPALVFATAPAPDSEIVVSYELVEEGT
jgi:hypothetical protein